MTIKINTLRIETALKPDQRAIRAAVAEGVHKYWDDAAQQQVAYNEWKDRNFEGECRQISKGSIIDYVTAELMRSNDEYRQGQPSSPASPRAKT
jgi:hypothetical protein